jgi:apolipoprotein N-acyltransferase
MNKFKAKHSHDFILRILVHLLINSFKINPSFFRFFSEIFMTLKRNFLIDFTVIFLGILLTFAFAPFAIYPLAVIAPAGLMFFLLSASPKRAFWLGYLFGIGLFGAGVYWIFISIHFIGDLSTLFSVIITSGLVAILACFPATACYLTNRYFPSPASAKILFAFPAIWVIVEWIRSWILTGFAWLFLGYSQTNSPLRGFAPILSVYGVSLAVLISSALLVFAFIYFKQKNYKQMYLHLLVLFLIWTIGAALSFIPWTRPNGQPITVSLIQGNVPQTIKWDPKHVNVSLDRYKTLTESVWGKSKIIIWPESSVPLPLANASEFINSLDEKAQQTGSHLILGVPIENETKNGYYNALVTLGDVKSVYLKRRLVPFGEYIPLRDFIARALKFMEIPMSNIVSGANNQQPLTLENTTISASICFEITFPEMIRSTDKNLGLLLSVTNDAWFGYSSAQAQHLQMAAMRAIELGRPVLFASNDGITAVINPDGKIAAAAPQRQIFVLNTTVQPTYGLTPWMKNGMDPILIILIGLLIAAIRCKRNFAVLNNDNEKKDARTISTSNN